MTESQRIRNSIKRDNQRRGLRGIVTKSTDKPIPTSGPVVGEGRLGAMTYVRIRGKWVRYSRRLWELEY